MISTDLCIIGSGPAALFAVFEAGQFNLHCHIVRGYAGENRKIYNFSDTPLYEILMDKISVFKPGISAEEWVEDLEQDECGNYIVVTNQQTLIYCKSILFASEKEGDQYNVSIEPEAFNQK